MVLISHLQKHEWVLVQMAESTCLLPESVILQKHTTPLNTLSLSPSWLTGADALIIQFSRGVAEVSQSAVLAVLAPGVVLTADACDDVQVVDVAAAVGVAIALTVWKRRDTF